MLGKEDRPPVSWAGALKELKSRSFRLWKKMGCSPQGEALFKLDFAAEHIEQER